jgi:hypothetical protein
MLNSVALFVAIAIALCSTADFLYHRSRKKNKKTRGFSRTGEAKATFDTSEANWRSSLRGVSPVGFRYKKTLFR